MNEYDLCFKINNFSFSLSEAIELAKEIAKVNYFIVRQSLLILNITINFTYQFPQECMLRDRASAWHSTYSSPNFQDAVEYEMSNSLEVLAQVNS